MDLSGHLFMFHATIGLQSQPNINKSLIVSEKEGRLIIQ